MRPDPIAFLARVLVRVLLLPLWLVGLGTAWRAQRRLRAYGPPAELALGTRPRLLQPSRARG